LFNIFNKTVFGDFMDLNMIISLALFLIGLPSVLSIFAYKNKKNKYEIEKKKYEKEILELEIEKEKIKLKTLVEENKKLDKIINKNINTELLE